MLFHEPPRGLHTACGSPETHIVQGHVIEPETFNFDRAARDRTRTGKEEEKTSIQKSGIRMSGIYPHAYWAHRKPKLALRLAGPFLKRFEARRYAGLSNHEPPRRSL